MTRSSETLSETREGIDESDTCEVIDESETRESIDNWLRSIGLRLPNVDGETNTAARLATFDREIEAWNTTRTMRGAVEAFSRLQYWAEAVSSMQIDAANDDGLTLAQALTTGMRSRYGDRMESAVNAARMSQVARMARMLMAPDLDDRPSDGEFLRDLHFQVMGSDPDAYGLPGRWRRCEMDIVDHRDGAVWNVGTRMAEVPSKMRRFADVFDRTNWSEYHPVVRAAMAHLTFERIHPFTDGNGRVGRVMMDIMHHENGLPIVPMNRVLEADRAEYHNHMTDAIFSGDVDHYVEYHVGAAVRAARYLRINAKAMEDAIDRVSDCVDGVEDIGGPRARRNLAMDLTSIPVTTTSDIATRHRTNVSPKKAQEIFTRLEKAGLGERRLFDRRICGNGRRGEMFMVTAGIEAMRRKPPEELWRIERNPVDLDALKREAAEHARANARPDPFSTRNSEHNQK